jgi:hypothetical protein
MGDRAWTCERCGRTLQRQNRQKHQRPGNRLCIPKEARVIIPPYSSYALCPKGHKVKRREHGAGAIDKPNPTICTKCRYAIDGASND